MSPPFPTPHSTRHHMVIVCKHLWWVSHGGHLSGDLSGHHFLLLWNLAASEPP
jgi:hypothetical protein